MDAGTFEDTAFDPLGLKAYLIARARDRERTNDCNDCNADGDEPPRLDGDQSVACQHEGEIQRLLIECTRGETRTTSLETRMTAIEENIRVQERARELVRSGKSDEQIAAEKRRAVYIGVAMLLMPIITAILNKLWK